MVKAVITGEKRLGGFVPATISVGLGLAVGAVAALNSTEFVQWFSAVTEDDILEANTIASRVALVVVAAAGLAFIGVILDVVHAPESRWVDLVVRCLALSAGATALVGSLLALPPTIHEAVGVAVSWAGGAVIVFALGAGVIRNSRRAKARPQ